MNQPTDAPPTPIKKNNYWIYFFVFVFVTSIGVAAFMIWFNLSIQLNPEQLENAIRLWNANRPKNYNLVYTKRLNDDSHTDKFEVEVSEGVVTKVLMNGNSLDKELRPFHSMDRLLRDIEKFSEMDAKPGAPRVYVTAIFDPHSGALRRYVRRVMGTNLRIEMQINIDALP
ncbi:MAG: hypothetical protein FJ303_23450 [Planctomycetes bacterium]|nr:hypothetical protein [Planctomycetota bacterium]